MDRLGAKSAMVTSPGNGERARRTWRDDEDGTVGEGGEGTTGSFLEADGGSTAESDCWFGRRGWYLYGRESRSLTSMALIILVYEASWSAAYPGTGLIRFYAD